MQKVNRQETGYIFLLGIILLYAVAARFYGLDSLSLWSDELWVVIESRKGSLWEMLRYVYYNDNHPPGYYLLIRFTQQLLGTSDFAIRLPSAIAGVLLVAFVYVAGRKHLSPEAALIASALTAGSYPLIFYSQEARANIFLALFGLMAFHYFRALVIEGDRDKKNIYLFWISGVFLEYLHYSGMVYVACLALIHLFLLVKNFRKSEAVFFLKIFLPILLCYIPWLPGVYYDLTQSPPEEWQKIPDFRRINKTMIVLFGPDKIRCFIFQATILFSAMAVFLGSINPVYRKKMPLNFIGLAIAAGFLPIAFFYIKSNVSQPAYNDRHFIYITPLVSMITAYFIFLPVRNLSLSTKRIYVFVFVFIIIFSQIHLNLKKRLYSTKNFKEEYREASLVVTEDSVFSNEARKAIFSSNAFFDHYLTRFSNNKMHSDLIYEGQEGLSDLINYVASNQIIEFYYLERIQRVEFISVSSKALAAYYRPVCSTILLHVRVTKFFVGNQGAFEGNWEGLSSCPGSIN